jgi:hypothetical protein
LRGLERLREPIQQQGEFGTIRLTADYTDLKTVAAVNLSPRRSIEADDDPPKIGAIFSLMAHSRSWAFASVPVIPVMRSSTFGVPLTDHR